MNTNNNQEKIKNNISWLIVFILIVYMGVTQRINSTLQNAVASESEATVIKYELIDLYKSQGEKVTKKCVIDPSYDGVKINTYYKDKSGLVYIDFSDLRLNKRYLMKVTTQDVKDKKATYNMNNSLLINSEDVINTIKDKEDLKRYTCFYLNDYLGTDTEDLIELDRSILDYFDEYLDKEYATENKVDNVLE